MILGCLSIVSWSSSPALTAVLYDLSRQIPQLKKDIQDGLLKMLSLVLMHKPLRHPGMPKGLAHQLASPSLTNIPEASDVGSITLALRTLGSFEFEGKNLAKDTAGNLDCHILFLSLFLKKHRERKSTEWKNTSSDSQFIDLKFGSVSREKYDFQVWVVQP